MFPEFAYSGVMQLILAVIAFLSAFVFVYLIAELILAIFGEKASVAQKSLFALAVGVILNEAWIYGVYIVGGMRAFSQTVYVLIVTPNPVFAMLYYFLGIKLLKLSPVRSIRLMGHVYLYYLVMKSVNRLIGSIFFSQTQARYNFMLDAIAELAYIALFFAIYCVTRQFIRQYCGGVSFGENLIVSVRREMLTYFLRSAAAYLLTVCAVCFIPGELAANTALALVLTQLLIIAMLMDFYRASKDEAKNKEAHIAVLKGELHRQDNPPELRGRLNENLSLVSMLIGRYEYARGRGVDMNIALRGSVENLLINNPDACCIIDGLLSDAIETSARSDERRVYFAIGSNREDIKLIVINNSAPWLGGAGRPRLHTTAHKADRCGRGTASARRILAKYGNCALHIDHYNREMSVYLEIRGIK